MPSDVDVHHLDEDTLNDDISNLAVLSHAVHARIHTTERNANVEYVREVKVTGMRLVGEEMTYDIQMEPPANKFVANGIFVHNTGKTTLLCAIAHHFEDWKIAFCSLTGKAVSVLKQKFIQQNVRSERHVVSTIHSLLYTPSLDKFQRIIGLVKKKDLDYSLIVIDEGSLVNENILYDILPYGIPVLAVGDHGQLPPVEGAFNLMSNPEPRLDDIDRQAKGSPVLALTEYIRKHGEFPRTYTNTTDVQFLRKDQIEEVLSSLYSTPGFRLDDLALLCFKNKTRIKLNAIARSIRWGKDVRSPIVGDQVICLRNS